MVYSPALLLLFVFLASQGCGGGQLNLEPEEETREEEGREDVTYQPPAGLVMKISSDKQQYLPGEIAEITATVENNSSETVTWWTSCRSIPIISVGVDTEYVGAISLPHPPVPWACATAIDQGTLEVGEARNRSVYWNLTLQDDIPAPAGNYPITAYMRISDGNYGLVGTVEATLEIEIVSDNTYLNLEEALAKAFAHQSIQDWYQANEYDRECYLKNRLSTVSFEVDGKASLHNVIPIAESTSRTPGCSVQFVEGPQWRVGFFNKLGVLPGDFSLSIDAVSGDVIEVKNSR